MLIILGDGVTEDDRPSRETSEGRGVVVGIVAAVVVLVFVIDYGLFRLRLVKWGPAYGSVVVRITMP